MRQTITVRVNGQEETHEVASHQTLLSFLRDTLNLTGAKEGCNEGECGACMVLLDGKAVNSCLVLAVECQGREIATIESLGSAGKLHPIQDAFLRNHAVQCGFCSPGMIMTTVGLLQENPNPSEQEIRTALAGNLCRCTGYRQIMDAIQDAAKVMRAQTRQQARTRRTA